MAEFLSAGWGGLSWSPFIPFGADLSGVSRQGGLYRVRVAGADLLAYVGQTGRDLMERLRALIGGTLAAEMPFNDPHTAAPRLWSYRQAEGMRFEVSAARADLPKRERLGEECRLIWHYRGERGASPLCNFGRLHPRYLPSKARGTGERGRPLRAGEPDNDGGVSLPPLVIAGDPAGPGWLGLDWSAPRPLTLAEMLGLPERPGVYRIGTGSEVVYLGEGEDLGRRLRQHGARPRAAVPLWFSYACVPGAVQKAQRLEVECDLIGAFVTQTGALPRLQFMSEDAPAE